MIPSGGTLAAFAAASLALILLPGPSVAYILTSTLRSGRRCGVAGALGIETGYLVHVAGTVLGISALIAASATAFTVVKVAGAAYLLVLAVRAWRGAGSAAVADRPAPVVASPLRSFLLALPVGVLNPKTAIFFLAFLPQFVDPAAGSAAGQLAVLGLLFIALAAVIDVQWALLGPGLRRLLPRPQVLDRISAGVYTALAVVTVRASRLAG